MYYQKHTFVIIAICLTSLLTGGGVYKWTDEEGNLHYGDNPPEQVKKEELHIAPGPDNEETQRARQRMEHELEDLEKRNEQRKGERIKKEEEFKETDTAKQDKPLSLEELDRQCEEARQKEITLLREKAIQECLAAERNTNTLEYCEKINSSVGQGGYCDNCGPLVRDAGGAYIQQGRVIPPMFYDLPECVEAFNAREKIKKREMGFE